jgi:ATP-dependent DNA helicase RecG
MLNTSEILQIIDRGENSSVEFKSADVRPESIAREIVGFANSQGGIILLGVEDDGRTEGIDITKKYDEWVTNISRNNVIPPIDCVYYETKLSDASIGIIEVPKGFDKPYQTTDGKFLIRVNTTLRTASQGELLRLFQQSGVFHYDLTGVANTTISDLNMFQIDKYFEKYGLKLTNETNDEQINILKNADILSQSGEMTVAGALIFGINPPKYLPQSGISYAKFANNDLSSELLDKKEIEGTLDVVIDICTTLIQMNIPTPSDIIGNLRVDLNKTWSKKSLREIVANACIHRNYSITGSKIRVFMFPNRIEIISPGRLPNTVTIDKLKIGVSYSVNPVISKFMENLGYIDKLGRGIPMVYNESKNIQKQLELKEIGEEFKVTMEL